MFLSDPPHLGCDNSGNNSAAFYTADWKLFSPNLLCLSLVKGIVWNERREYTTSLSPSRRREAPCEGTNPPRLFTPGETKALAKSKVHQISRAWVTVSGSVGGHPHWSQKIFVKKNEKKIAEAKGKQRLVFTTLSRYVPMIL
jgi:hypothetical protein